MDKKNDNLTNETVPNQQTNNPVKPSTEAQQSPITQPANNIINQPVSPASSQPSAQPVPAQPTAQPAPAQPAPAQPAPIQPNIDQPITSQPITGENTAINTNEHQLKPKSNQKKTAIIISIVAGIILLAVIIILIIVFLGGGGKTISCKSKTSMMGIDMDFETSIKVKDGKISSGNVDAIINLKSLSDTYASQEQTLVDSIVENYKKQCADGCSFTHEYAQHDYLKVSTTYDVSGVDSIVYTSETDNLSTEELADQIQSNLESTMPGETTCQQN